MYLLFTHWKAQLEYLWSRIGSKSEYRPVAMAHACNPSILGGWSGRIASAQEFETCLGNMVKPHLYKKIQKLAEHGGAHLYSQLLVGAVVGGSLEPRRFEAAVSWDSPATLQPRWQQDPILKKKNSKHL